MEQQKKKMGLGKKILIGVGIIFIIGLIGSQLDKDKKSTATTSKEVKSQDKAPDTTIALSTSTAEKPSETISAWSYSEDEDKMTSKKINYASVTAKDELEFDFPYNGGAVATFTIRKKNNRTDIYLQVSKGQFNNTFDGGQIRIRFDENSPKKYSFSGASDASSDIIFINSTKDVISKIKVSKKMLVEAEFFNEGNRQMEFDITGLKWD